MKKHLVTLMLAMALAVSFAGAAPVFAADKTVETTSSPAPDALELRTASDADVVTMLSDERAMYRAFFATEAGGRGLTAAKPRLKHLLSDPDELVRVEAAGALLRLTERSGVPVLRAALSNEASRSRLTAARYLSLVADKQAVAVLQNYLTSKLSFERDTAVHALAALKDDSIAYAALVAGLQDENDLVRQSAIYLLGGRTGERSTRMLREILQTSQVQMERGMAISSLERLGTPAVVLSIIDALADESPVVSVAARRALLKLTRRIGAPEGVGLAQAEDWRAWWAQHRQEYKEHGLPGAGG
ncbi:MAG: HEAT repeat domain-containing protein [Armatimonadetes bacterium]|nr:HEAT repeat domain-containing protein [Armatimonadota bacterium]